MEERKSHYLGSLNDWRSKRLNIAVALRKQGWTYQKIGEHLAITPKTIGRDIKCYVIKKKMKEEELQRNSNKIT